jgi:hypothetical protein
MRALRAANNAVGDAETIWLRLRFVSVVNMLKEHFTTATPRIHRDREKDKILDVTDSIFDRC